MTVHIFRLFVKLYFHGRTWGRKHLLGRGSCVAAIKHNNIIDFPQVKNQVYALVDELDGR